MRYWPHLLGGISLSGGGLILLLCGAFSIEPPFALPVFCIALAASLVSAVALGNRRHRLTAALVLALAANLLFLSFGPWYIEHGAPGPTAFSVHRHTLWDLCHVH